MLQRQVATIAMVLRDGAQKAVPVKEIVPGDILLFKAGDFVPTDTRLLEATDLYADQADVTGESTPVRKDTTTPTEGQLLVMDFPNCVFNGLEHRERLGEGNRGENRGKRALRPSHVAPRKQGRFNRIQTGARKFRYIVLQFTLILVILVFFFLSLSFALSNPQDSLQDWMKYILLFFLFALALAAGLTPDMLSTINYMNLMKGALNMAKPGLFVKRLKSIQNMNSMDVVCLDKTGTLTQNKTEEVRYLDALGTDDEKVFHFASLNSYFHAGLKTMDDLAVLENKDVSSRGLKKSEKFRLISPGNVSQPSFEKKMFNLWS